MIEPMRQPIDVTDSFARAVHKRLHVDAVDDGVLIPEVKHTGSPNARALPFVWHCPPNYRVRQPEPVGVGHRSLRATGNDVGKRQVLKTLVDRYLVNANSLDALIAHDLFSQSLGLF